MSSRGSARLTLACVAALTLGLAASIQAQDTTRTKTDTRSTRTTRSVTKKVTSQKRIPVTKRESGGEVQLTTPSQDSIAKAEQARMEQMRQDSIANIEKMRQDSIKAIEKARQDSIDSERHRTDSLAAIESARKDSLARVDSLAREQQLMRGKTLKMNHGFYAGFAAGPSSPLDNFKNIGYSTGYDITVPIGWQSNNQVLGARLDLGYGSFKGTSYSTTMTTTTTDASGNPITTTAPVVLTNPNAKVYSAALNATARFPITKNKQTGIYLLGGGGWYHFGNYGASSALSGYLGNNVFTGTTTSSTTTTTTTSGTTATGSPYTTPTGTTTTSGASYSSSYKNSVNKFGVDAGAGLDYGIGHAALFVETRFTNVFGGNMNNINLNGTTTTSTKNLRWMPVVLGIKFR
jgi:hypothetical protein